MTPKELSLKIPSDGYLEIQAVLKAAHETGGRFMLKANEDGSIEFKCGDKTAFLPADDPLQDVIRRQWWGVGLQ